MYIHVVYLSTKNLLQNKESSYTNVSYVYVAYLEWRQLEWHPTTLRWALHQVSPNPFDDQGYPPIDSWRAWSAPGGKESRRKVDTTDEREMSEKDRERELARLTSSQADFFAGGAWMSGVCMSHLPRLLARGFSAAGADWPSDFLSTIARWTSRWI